jgi:type IV pilus assembly protein PilW
MRPRLPPRPHRRNARPPRRHAGFGLVEILVGVVIGLLALLVIYQALALSEGYKRSTTAGGDAQSAGMISTFILAQDVGNAGHGIAPNAQELATCPSTGNFATTWRPIPVLIRDGGNDFTSDSFDVFYSVNPRIATPLEILTTYNPGGTIDLQSPLGFEVGNMFVMSDVSASSCAMGTVTAMVGPNAGTGIVNITPTPIATAFPQGATWVVNLGAANQVRKVRYDVQAGVIRSLDLINAAAVPNPVVSNIVLLKAQYGLDTDGNQFIDTWVSARNAPWREADVLVAPIAQLRQIKAIRLAVVVRSSQFERATDAEGRAAVTDLTGDFTVTLFDCNGLMPCTGQMAGVTIPGTANYRHRVFEQVIPLRNQVWNP